MKKSFSFTMVFVALGFSVWFFYPAQEPALMSSQPEQSEMAQQPIAQPSVAIIEKDENSERVGSRAGVEAQVDLPLPVKSAQYHPSQSEAVVDEIEINAESEFPPGLNQNQEVATPNPAFLQNEQQFWDEKTDEVWAASSSDHIADFFEQQDSRLEGAFGSKLNNVECRSTMCKVEVVHDDLKAEQDFGLKFATGLVDQQIKSITFQSEKNPDGRIVEVMYVSK